MTNIFGHFKKAIKYSYRFYSISGVEDVSASKRPPWKILFFGNDEFSLYSLKALFKEYSNKTGILSRIEVVTCSQINLVWKFSTEHQLSVRKWPPDLKNCDFDLGVVVSFGHLIPEQIISKFPLGMLNVHASLLPRWRGASPIVHALANGDKETGVTIMRIRPKKFDIGEILYQEKVPISLEIEMPELHEQLGKLGGRCLIETIQNINERVAQCMPQPEQGATYASKITPEFGQIKWSASTATDVHNLQRALKSVLPLKTTWNSVQIKLFDIAILHEQKECVTPGFLEYSKKNKLLIVECANSTWISVKKVGIQGKKTMSAADFYNGFMSKQAKNLISCFI